MSQQKVIGQLWADYLTKCVPDAAGEAQINDTKAAFFAGASTVFDVLTNMPDDEDVCMRLFDDIHKEFVEFAAELAKRSVEEA